MTEIRRDEIRTGEAYEGARAESRRGIAELKRHRRVAIGDVLSLVFENRETIRSVIEEVVRIERLRDETQVEHEVEAFNEVVPPEGALGATLYIEAEDQADLAGRLEELDGVERCTYIEIAGMRVDGVPHKVSIDDEAPAASYIGFTLRSEQRRAWIEGAAVYAGVDHPALRARTQLDREQCEALAFDLR